MSEKQQRLVYAIIEFLNQSIKDGTVRTDDQESMEVAIQCIGEAFNVDPSDEEQSEKLSVKPATLQSIFDVFIKTRDKVSTGPPSASSSHAPGSSAEDKSKAEKAKQEGNAQMSSKNYDAAIDAYSKAVALDPNNPVYYSNRAAAYSSKGDHLAAIGDAEQAIAVDPNFIKAYHRLGHAQYSLEDFKAAATSFERGLKLDPNNAGLKSGLQNAKSRISTADGASVSATERAAPSNPAGAAAAGGAPGLAGMADMFRNMGGGGGGGGMPDLGSLMNNPQFMSMAQQMMANGGLEQLMQNPSLANMMERVQSGNMPSMDDIMSDPSLRQLADQFGGAGRRG